MVVARAGTVLYRGVEAVNILSVVALQATLEQSICHFLNFKRACSYCTVPDDWLQYDESGNKAGFHYAYVMKHIVQYRRQQLEA